MGALAGEQGGAAASSGGPGPEAVHWETAAAETNGGTHAESGREPRGAEGKSMRCGRSNWQRDV